MSEGLGVYEVELMISERRPMPGGIQVERFAEVSDLTRPKVEAD